MLKTLVILLLGGLLVSYGSSAIPNGAIAISGANFGAGSSVRWLHFPMDAFNPATDVGNCLSTLTVAFTDGSCAEVQETVYHFDEAFSVDKLFLTCALASTEDTDVITFKVIFANADRSTTSEATAQHTFAATEDDDQIEIAFGDVAPAGTATIQLEVDAYTDNSTTATTDLECSIDMKVI